jgi:glutamine amidotransferase
MKVCILDYNAGNITSIIHALSRSSNSGRKTNTTVTNDPAELSSATHIILPGVGAANSAMQFIYKKGLSDFIRSLTQPVLGICLGLQILCEHSEEGNTPCVGIFPYKVKRLQVNPPVSNLELQQQLSNHKKNVETIKIPHVGWNHVKFAPYIADTLMCDIPQSSAFYFSHGYYAEGAIDATTIAGLTQHGVAFPSILCHNNFYATQFHPEKSGVLGAKLLENFLKL